MLWTIWLLCLPSYVMLSHKHARERQRQLLESRLQHSPLKPLLPLNLVLRPSLSRSPVGLKNCCCHCHLPPQCIGLTSAKIMSLEYTIARGQINDATMHAACTCVVPCCGPWYPRVFFENILMFTFWWPSNVAQDLEEASTWSKSFPMLSQRSQVHFFLFLQGFAWVLPWSRGFSFFLSAPGFGYCIRRT